MSSMYTWDCSSHGCTSAWMIRPMQALSLPIRSGAPLNPRGVLQRRQIVLARHVEPHNLPALLDISTGQWQKASAKSIENISAWSGSVSRWPSAFSCSWRSHECCLIHTALLTTSVALGRVIRSSTLHLELPPDLLISRMILAFFVPSSFVFRIRANFDMVPLSGNLLVSSSVSTTLAKFLLSYLASSALASSSFSFMDE